MSFSTIHTSYGLQRMAAAEAAGEEINLTHMAVGDGNGNAVTPTEDQTQLVRERYRAAVNRVYSDPDNPLRYTAELIIPASEGGFTLREVGVFDSDGGLFVVGNLPDTYKPQDSEGAFADTVVRVEFLVSNASVVTLQVDPNVAVATQNWISNNITAGALIPGGTTGQILAKASNADGDVVWQDPTEANVTVDTIDELQTLADGQTQVDLALTTTYGLAVYIEGVRLARGSGADQWEPDATVETRLYLGKSYPAGTEILCVQNEPAGSAPAPLERAQNLSDLENVSTARTNLDVYSKSQTRQMAPAGMVATFARSTAPTGWLKANGAAVSRTAYADLFAAIGTTFGAGDGFNTFNLPDLRGEFVRGCDDGRGVDAGRVFGSWQDDDLKSHNHNSGVRAPDNLYDLYGHTTAGSNSWGTRRTDEPGFDNLPYTSSTGGTETRPRNVALLYCIKY